MFRKYWKIIVPMVLLVLALTGCADRENISLKHYKIHKMDGLASAECMDFLQDAVRQAVDVKLGTVNRNYQRSIYLVSDQEYAQGLGYSLEQMDAEGFVITNRGGSIYLLAPSEEGLNRASSYFAKHYIQQDGTAILAEGENYVENGRLTKSAVYIGETPINEYTITYADGGLMSACRELQYYIQQTGGGYPEIARDRKADSKKIQLMVDEKLARDAGVLEIAAGEVSIRGGSETALLEQVYLFINTYLGWSKAGEEGGHISNTASVIRVPENVAVREAWIEEREAIVTLWNVNYSRGAYLDPDVSLKNNIIDYSEDQIYEYVKMLKYCGFTGVQVTEMCSTWAGVGSYEACHDKLRMIADAAHSLGMKFTLWVWGGEFADCGWVDDEVTFDYKNLGYTFNNPEVLACVEKYYNIYAELADCCDRVIGHYYDPGNFYSAEEIAYYAKKLKDKFHAVNPDIDFGISCWVDVYDKQVFVRELGNDVTLYECGQRDNENTYASFRTQINQFGCRLGTWAWNTCEMEIDQLAQMNFNLEIIRSVYQTAKKYDGIMKPSYWSEMDSYHLLNVFSLYCAGQLLINPDTESEVIYEQISTATVGPEYAAEFAELLSIIQDARSGYTYDTFFWSNENYILKSDAYPAEEILERCNRVLPILQEMIDKKIESYTLPLPVSLEALLRMIQPHLVQIRDYAEFRIGLAQLEADYEKGVAAKVLSERLYEISDPIKNYNTVIGAWGQIEARAQYEMVMDFCGRTGLEVPIHETFQAERKQRIIAQLRSYQREEDEPYILREPYYQLGLAYGPAETNRLVQELVDEGFLIREKDGGVYLVDWDKYLYHFDS